MSLYDATPCYDIMRHTSIVTWHLANHTSASHDCYCTSGRKLHGTQLSNHLAMTVQHVLVVFFLGTLAHLLVFVQTNSIYVLQLPLCGGIQYIDRYNNWWQQWRWSRQSWCDCAPFKTPMAIELIIGMHHCHFQLWKTRNKFQCC